MSEELQKLLELIEVHERRLHKREIQAAMLGNNVSSDESGILEDIDTIKQHLRGLYAKLGSITIRKAKTTELTIKWANKDFRKMVIEHAANKRKHTILFKKWANRIKMVLDNQNDHKQALASYIADYEQLKNNPEVEDNIKDKWFNLIKEMELITSEDAQRLEECRSEVKQIYDETKAMFADADAKFAIARSMLKEQEEEFYKVISRAIEQLDNS
jgi:hypothetical protein